MIFFKLSFDLIEVLHFDLIALSLVLTPKPKCLDLYKPAHVGIIPGENSSGMTVFLWNTLMQLNQCFPVGNCFSVKFPVSLWSCTHLIDSEDMLIVYDNWSDGSRHLFGKRTLSHKLGEDLLPCQPAALKYALHKGSGRKYASQQYRPETPAWLRVWS